MNALSFFAPEGRCLPTLTSPPEPVRLFQISYRWQRYGKVFSAHTVWGFRGDGKAALANFTARNPHVFCARVEREEA